MNGNNYCNYCSGTAVVEMCLRTRCHVPTGTITIR